MASEGCQILAPDKAEKQKRTESYLTKLFNKAIMNSHAISAAPIGKNTYY